MKILNKIKCWWYGCDWELCAVMYYFAGEAAERLGIDNLALKDHDAWYCKRCNRKL
jgi:hypothetical protein